MNKNIVLLHGWGAKTIKLNPLENELKMAGWNVLNMKLPGFDLNPPNEPWGVVDYADYVLKKTSREFKNLPFFVFGHSFGGRIAMKMALENSNNMKGLVLCGASGISRTSIAKRYSFMVISKVGKLLFVIPQLALLIRKILYKAAREHDYERADDAMKGTFNKVVLENFHDIVGKIDDPTLILWGEQDRMVPVKDARYLNEKIEGSTIKVWKKEGHTLPYKKPKELAKEIDKWATSLQ